jgi:hypothetical protein
MTKIRILTGYVFTKLPVDEIRRYMQGGIKTNSFPGFEDEAGTIPILIHIHAIEYVYVS